MLSVQKISPDVLILSEVKSKFVFLGKDKLTSFLRGGGVRAVVSKRGVDDGNQKGGGSLQPAKKSQFIYTRKKELCQRKKIKFLYFYRNITRK